MGGLPEVTAARGGGAAAGGAPLKSWWRMDGDGKSCEGRSRELKVMVARGEELVVLVVMS